MPSPLIRRRFAGLVVALALVLVVVAACERASERAGERSIDTSRAAAVAPSAGVIDSALPIDTLLHRFRAALPDTPTVLAGGAASPEALTRALLAALAGADTATLRALAITPGEFAWLYYPHTRWTRPPYEMGPELVWLQVRANSEKGLTRLARRYGGQRLRFGALACPDSAATEGPNTILEGCRVTFAVADSAPRELRLFGSLLRRDGRYKFVSYSNDL
jgi:hypothetical protein